MKLNEALKRCRKLRKVTQKQAAVSAGVTEAMYQFYEYGKSEPTAGVLIALADYFDVPIDYLVGRGIYQNWDKLLSNKEAVFQAVESALPFSKELHLNECSEQDLITLIPLLLSDVQFSDNDIKITLLPFYKSQGGKEIKS